MHSCRRASDNPHAAVGQTTLLYKEAPEFLRRPWYRESAAGSQKLFRLRLGAATRNLAPAEWADEVCA